MQKNMKIAIVHDWLTGMRGGEYCLEVFCELFPDATIFTLLHKKGSVSKRIEAMKIKTSFIQKLPCSLKRYRNYLPLFAKAIESFDLSRFDLVLSSSHCVAKGVRLPKEALHICYCHTPMRYAWLFFDEYFGNMSFFKKMLISRVTRNLKAWDIKSNETVDFFIANSDNVRDRIKRFYKRDADTIYPPVSTGVFELSQKSDGFYLIISALVPYKRIDIAIRAFNENRKRLLVVGTGNCDKELRKIAKENIEFLGWASDEDLLKYYQRCKALIFPGEEDFGIVPLEAQACGKPVIAYAKGGALETIIPIDKSGSSNPTGVFFYDHTPEALIEAVEYFEGNEEKLNPSAIREHSLRFDREIFKEKIKKYIEDKI